MLVYLSPTIFFYFPLDSLSTASTGLVVQFPSSLLWVLSLQRLPSCIHLCPWKSPCFFLPCRVTAPLHAFFMIAASLPISSLLWCLLVLSAHFLLLCGCISKHCLSCFPWACWGFLLPHPLFYLHSLSCGMKKIKIQAGKVTRHACPKSKFCKSRDQAPNWSCCILHNWRYLEQTKRVLKIISHRAVLGDEQPRGMNSRYFPSPAYNTKESEEWHSWTLLPWAANVSAGATAALRTTEHQELTASVSICFVCKKFQNSSP